MYASKPVSHRHRRDTRPPSASREIIVAPHAPDEDVIETTDYQVHTTATNPLDWEWQMANNPPRVVPPAAEPYPVSECDPPPPNYVPSRPWNRYSDQTRHHTPPGREFPYHYQQEDAYHYPARQSYHEEKRSRRPWDIRLRGDGEGNITFTGDIPRKFVLLFFIAIMLMTLGIERMPGILEIIAGFFF